MSSALKQAEAIVDQLEPRERVQLLQYIAPRRTESLNEAAINTPDPDVAWKAFRAVGRRIAELPTNGQSATQAVSDMRR
jgi:hypothetical protein